MKHFVIVNPVSGRGRGIKLFPQIERIFIDSGLDFHLARTERPWHAAELSERAARDGYEVVISSGGDGTVNETLNGLMRAKSHGHDRTALGVLSIGTGNDFAAGLGIPADLHEAVRALKDGGRKLIDIGLVTGGDFPQGRYFGNCVGIGFDAAGLFSQRRSLGQEVFWPILPPPCKRFSHTTNPHRRSR